MGKAAYLPLTSEEYDFLLSFKEKEVRDGASIYDYFGQEKFMIKLE